MANGSAVSAVIALKVNSPNTKANRCVGCIARAIKFCESIQATSVAVTSVLERKRTVGTRGRMDYCIATHLVLLRVVDTLKKLAGDRLVGTELLTHKLCHQWIVMCHRWRLRQRSARQCKGRIALFVKSSDSVGSSHPWDELCKLK